MQILHCLLFQIVSHALFVGSPLFVDSWVACFLNRILLFWNQTFTWVSVSLIAQAS